MDGRKSGESKRAWGGALCPFPRTTLERPLRTRAQLRHVVYLIAGSPQNRTHSPPHRHIHGIADHRVSASPYYLNSVTIGHLKNDVTVRLIHGIPLPQSTLLRVTLNSGYPYNLSCGSPHILSSALLHARLALNEALRPRGLPVLRSYGFAC
jgi:hypothetical protein